VVVDVDENNVVQVITDNGSNYKKACRYLTNEYLHIAWQSCLGHTINLMLKTIGEFPDHKYVIDSAKLITKWLYNHVKLHAMMKTVICENLVRWIATRFGMNYLFLRFVDQERISNFSEFLFRYHILRQEYDALFHDDRTSFDQYIEIVNKRMHDITNDTYMNASKMN
jgi:hypothetical protein